MRKIVRKENPSKKIEQRRITKERWKKEKLATVNKCKIEKKVKPENEEESRCRIFCGLLFVVLFVRIYASVGGRFTDYGMDAAGW